MCRKIGFLIVLLLFFSAYAYHTPLTVHASVTENTLLAISPQSLSVSVLTTNLTQSWWTQNTVYAQVINKATVASDVTFYWKLTSYSQIVTSGCQTVFISGLDKKEIYILFPEIRDGTYQLQISADSPNSIIASSTLSVTTFPLIGHYDSFLLIASIIVLSLTLIVIIAIKRWRVKK